MKRLQKIVLGLVCAALMCFTCACGNGNTGGGGGTTDTGIDYNGTVNLFVPFDTFAYNGLERVKSAYRRLHPETKINITKGGDSYTTAVEGVVLAPEETDIDIVQINVVSQYYGTDKIIDFTPYLNQRNPYGEKNAAGQYPVWRTMLEEEAYVTEDNSFTVPSLSFESNYVVVYYSKQLFEKHGWTEPKNWSELLSLLQSAKDAGYTNPLGLNYDKPGVESIMTGLIMQMYMDQYFRDVIDEAHSQDGDYSYIDSLDYDWSYSADNEFIDSRSGYTYNLSRLINAYFKEDSTCNPASARFADMMTNLKDLTGFASSNYTGATIRNYFHNGVLTEITTDNKYKESETCVLFCNRLDYITDFQSSVGTVLGEANNVVPTDKLNDYLGWFTLPAMPDNQTVEGGAPAAGNVRTFGGPNHHPMGVINRNNKKRTDLAMDFMKFWYSPQGMDEYYSYYSERGIVCPLKLLVKDYELPENVKIDTGTDNIGTCVNNPYFEIGNGYNDTIQSGMGDTVRNNYVSIVREFLNPSNTSGWSGFGTRMLTNMQSGFPYWASYKNLKVTSYANISDYYRNSPIKAKQ